MDSMKFLLLAIPLVEAFIKPVGNELISRFLKKLNCSCPLRSESACPGHCENGWTYFDRADACYKRFFLEDFDMLKVSFVIELAKSGVAGDNYLKGTWIGLKQAKYPLSKEWTWTDGTEVDYTLWCKNQPDNDKGVEHCAQVFCDTMIETHIEYRKWNDALCYDRMRTFVCKKEAIH
ncbi:unnamed protein product [Cylicocyclus nassatus]|uniref:C-type lectin domain-containing protein n=1 Tax=Cylicocyclus nassatus TaxID=53992 RepID=A0AA36M9C3_CYLNA|nr:unnamed protein product [Cylicocyclus nassatus]